MEDLLPFLDLEQFTEDPVWQEVVGNGAEPELSGILKRVSERQENLPKSFLADFQLLVVAGLQQPAPSQVHSKPN